MSLTYSDIEQVTAGLHALLPGARVQKIHMPDEAQLTVELRVPQATRTLLISVHPRYSRLHLTQRKFANPATPYSFCAFLRKRLEGARVERVGIVNHDRIVEVEFQALHEGVAAACFLVCELMGPFSNLLLLDGGRRIVRTLRPASAKGRALGAGELYHPPVRRGRREEPEPPPVALDEAGQLEMDRRYARQIVEEEAALKREDLLRRARAHRKKLAGRIASLQRETQDAQRAGEYRKIGELLLAQLHTVKRGADSAVVQDYYAPGGGELRVALNPARSPRENAEEYFKKYRKLERAQGSHAARIAEAQAALERFDRAGAVALLEAARSMNEVIIAEDRLRDVGVVIKRREKGSPRRSAGPHRFRSDDGFQVFVGRNAAENDELTMKQSAGHDFFFHAANAAGSHVIVKTRRGQELPYETILDAAQLAKHFSKARDWKRVEVYYAQRKNVMKPPRAKPGLVYLRNEKVIAAETDEPRLRRLMLGEEQGEDEAAED